MAQVVITPNGGGMESVKRFLGFGKHNPIPGSKPKLEDSIAEVFSRLVSTPKMGNSIGVLYKFKLFLLSFKEGQVQAKNRTSQIGENLQSGHIKQSSTKKSRESLESMLIDSGSSSKDKKGSLKNTEGLIPSYYEEK
jgi:hypothetical protein